MELEWDEAKRDSNRLKHKIDFADLAPFFAGNLEESLDTRHDYGEIRMRALGMLFENLLFVIYTKGGNSIRLISARRALPTKQEEYYDPTL